MQAPQAASSRTAKISKQQATSAVDEIQEILRQRWSYYPFSANDIDKAIESLRAELGSEVSVSALALAFQKVIALGIDGHAGASGWQLDSGYLPFLIDPSGDRFVAVNPMRSRFLVDDHPFIVSIDGRPIADWLGMAKQLIANGSPHYVTAHGLRLLRNIEHWRGEMGLPRGGPLKVALTSRDGNQSTTLELAVAARPPATSEGPPRLSRPLPQNIGFLRLESMNDAAIREIRNWMPQFRESAGLVIDVRGNGGGSREPLRELFSYFMAEDDPPRIVNCAKYRLYRGFPADHLVSRFMYPASAGRWTKQERAAIDRFRNAFRPEREPPAVQFSDWHYMVLSRLESPEIYHYSKPVVVLMNELCFSATDIFLAGLKGWRNITLVGTPSGGGSARIEAARLSSVPISLRLGSMVSYMPSGQLFDGNGVQPDVLVEPSPEFLIGGADNVLAQAIDTIRGRSKPAPPAPNP
jgi:hypothetical protein